MSFYHLTLVSIAQFLFLFSFFWDWSFFPTLYFSLSNALEFINIYSVHWCTGMGSYQLTRINCTHMCPAPSSMTSCWQLEIGHGRSIYITETGKCHKSGCYFQRENYYTLTSSPLFLSFSGYDKKKNFSIFFRFLTKSKIKYLEFLLRNTKF